MDGNVGLSAQTLVHTKISEQLKMDWIDTKCCHSFVLSGKFSLPLPYLCDFLTFHQVLLFSQNFHLSFMRKYLQD